LCAWRRNFEVFFVFVQMDGQKREVDDPDVELMLRVRRGDEAAFRKLFALYAGPLVGFVDRFFYNRAIAEEVVQEVFLKVFRARRSYKPKAKFTTWLYTIATRTALNELRRGVYRNKIEGLSGKDAQDLAGPDPAAEETLAGKELAGTVEAVLRQLPDNQRAAFLLVRFGGRSYSEVASILGISVSAVKSVVFRATEAVRSSLEQGKKKEGGS